MKNGPYILIIPPDDYPGKRYRGRYAYEHRVNWWKETGNNPDDYQEYVIHHKNENKHDNDPENLDSVLLSNHSKMHAEKRPEEKVQILKIHICENCNKEFKNRSNKSRFCSRKCIGLFGFARKSKPEIWTIIKIYVEQGMSDYKIAKVTGIPRPTVQRVRSKNGCQTSRGRKC